MNDYNTPYEFECYGIAMGEKCRGLACSGYIVSDFDTVEKCGCGHHKFYLNPYNEDQEEIIDLNYCQKFVGKFMVTALDKTSKKNYCQAILNTMQDVKELLKVNPTFKAIKINRADQLLQILNPTKKEETPKF